MPKIDSAVFFDIRGRGAVLIFLGDFCGDLLYGSASLKTSPLARKRVAQLK
jgi:hypothetical protein